MRSPTTSLLVSWREPCLLRHMFAIRQSARQDFIASLLKSSTVCSSQLAKPIEANYGLLQRATALSTGPTVGSMPRDPAALRRQRSARMAHVPQSSRPEALPQLDSVSLLDGLSRMV